MDRLMTSALLVLATLGLTACSPGDDDNAMNTRASNMGNAMESYTILASDTVCGGGDEVLGAYTEASQQDAFRADLEGCTVYQGDLQIELEGGFDLSALADLRLVLGYLYISGRTPDAQYDLSGLGSLVYVRDEFTINGGIVEELGDMVALREVGGSFDLFKTTGEFDVSMLVDNPVKVGAVTLQGLGINDEDDLSFIKGDLFRIRLLTTSLTTLDGLGEVTSVTKLIELTSNRELTSIDKLRSVERVQVLEVQHNSKLDSCHVREIAAQMNVEDPLVIGMNKEGDCGG